ncbi:hypothetical protein GZ77_13650 [Endozoicomonas montiporae]|uniref:Uncharacterized protein n=2 Tax=Endozoicomonas montiporae TaxID=1027273 RepID=A0A081N4Q0_9GAMM|nr:hypothetical protein [Endozoicomonas montiporae]AMO57698.1 hypothetical protein EZMO1_3745 [Endozoicomonas montiporae CL-33]KEQ13423.1 hypothetical protein GZ77_13650 [Endozoicomonas montiporae]
MQLYTAEQINNMERKALMLEVMPARDIQVIDESINRFTKQALETYVDTFGTSERFRVGYDQEGRIKAAVALEEAFWVRSYIRSVYGIKIGSIPVEYPKYILNADYYLGSTTIGSHPIRKTSQLTDASNRAKEAEASLHDTNTHYIGALLKHLTTMATGSSKETTAKKFIITLVKQDLDEELELSKPGGLRVVRENYRKRFYPTPTEKKYIKDREELFFYTPDSDDIEADVGVVDSDTLRGVIKQCIASLEMMESRLNEARSLRMTIETLKSGNKATKNRIKRAEL